MLDIDTTVAGGRRTAHEYVRDSLRAAILRGSISGGTRLVQADLARQLEVSTTPVREALRDLATEGLIHLDAHRGAIVKKLDYGELMEVYELTRLLEPYAVRLASGLSEHPEIDEAEELAERMEQETDVGLWVDLNRRFHHALVAGVANQRLLGMLKSLRDAVAPYVGLALQMENYRFQTANRHHRDLIDAVRASDADRAEQIAGEHVELTTRQLGKTRHLFESDV